eukprot:Rhum_TRINITY_DN14154_c19_g1::Rhum_TRINITY_DN14154_c19_g1_i1::g.71089::m.71089/K16772/FAM161A; protein FAM161A
MQTHYVDPHTSVLSSVRRTARVEHVTHEDARAAVVDPDEDALASLRAEQADIEARMRELEEEERRLLHGDPTRGATTRSSSSAAAAAAAAQQGYHPTQALRGMRDEHADRLEAYERLLDEQTARASSVREASPSAAAAAADDARHLPFYTRADYDEARDGYRRRREERLASKPFSFESRERAKRGSGGRAASSVRAECKRREEHSRRETESRGLVGPNGAREPFRATAVPPSTFMNRFEQMVVDDEERRAQNKERAAAKRAAREAAAASSRRVQYRAPYMSQPLVSRQQYVPVSEKMAGYQFKARPVPKTVKEQRWDKLAEAEVLRKLDIKETARYKLAEYDRHTPRCARSPGAAAWEPEETGGGDVAAAAAETTPARATVPQSARGRTRSLPPALPDACVFSPAINRSVPNFTRIREKGRHASVMKRPPKTTVPEEFNLSRPSYKAALDVSCDIELDEATGVEHRWPYMMPRTAPPRVPPPRGQSQPPTRYTKAANMSLLENSVKIVRREEARRAEEAEERRRAERQRSVSQALRRFDSGVGLRDAGGEADEEGGGGDPAWKLNTRQWKEKRDEMDRRLQGQKPIWMRQPEGQAEEAASRARAEALGAGVGGGGGGGGGGDPAWKL